MGKYGIEIKENNKTKIEEMLKTAEGRAVVRTGSYEDLVAGTEEIFEKFAVSKKALEGAGFEINADPQKFPNAYIQKGIPVSTHYYVQMHSGKWYVYKIERCRCTDIRVSAYFSEDLKAAILSKYAKF